MAQEPVIHNRFLSTEDAPKNGSVPMVTFITTSLPLSNLADLDATFTPNNWTAGLTAEYIIRNILSAFMVMVNLLVLVTLGSTASLRTAANLVIGSLAVTDLLVGLLEPVGLLIELELLMSPAMCRLGYATVTAFCSVSINHLVFLSVDRYLLISRPLRYQSLITKCRVWIFIGGCWAWGGALFASFILGLSLQPDWNGLCRAELMYRLWFMVFLVFVHFLLPFIIMLFVYSYIFVVVRRQRKALKKSFHIRTEARQDAEVRSLRAKLRAASLLILPCVYFYLSWGPYFGAVLWAVYAGMKLEPHSIERFVQMLAILNSLGNPILYAVSQPVLGKAMLLKLKSLGEACRKCCVCKGKSFTTITRVRPLPPSTLPSDNEK